jgi:hypothetical protein
MNEKNGTTSIGVWFFSVVGAVAVVLAAVAFLQLSISPSWLQLAIGLGAGMAFIAIGELWIRARYGVTANALDAAGIAILYAGLYWSHGAGLQELLLFAMMLVVTGVAVRLATRHDSMFIAVLGLLGGFATAYLLSPADNSGRALFAYLLALNIGIAWLTIRKGWWLLSSLAVIATALYEWRWVMESLDVAHLTLGVAIFTVFAVTGTAPLWSVAVPAKPALSGAEGGAGGRERPPLHCRIFAVAAAHLPLLFAVYVASQTNYASQFCILFGFLLIIDAGLLAIAWRGGPQWLHAAGGVATLIVFVIWFRLSYTHAAWPALLAWAVLFIALYLVRVTPFAGLMFGNFIGLGVHEPERWPAIVLTMFIMLAIVFFVAVKRGKPIVAAIAIAVSCIALMTMHPPLWTLVALHAILFAEIFVVAWISERHVLAVLAVPFLVAMVITAYSPTAWSQYSTWTLLAIAAVPYLLFIAYPLALGARAKASLAPYAAAALASLVLFLVARTAYLGGWVALAVAVLMAVLLWQALKLDPREPRVTLLLALTLAFSDVAVAMLLPKPWTVTLFALGVVVLVWLFLHLHHPLLLLWATGLAVFVFFRLAFDGDLFGTVWHVGYYNPPIYIAVYVVCGVAMFAAAYLIRIEQPLLQRVFSVACLFELWFLINILIANCYHSANGAVVFDFVASQPAENAVYTISWSVIATGLLILGFLIRWPAARGAALALVFAAVLKGFLNDVPRLAAPYLTASLIGLGLSVAVVAIVLQRRWAGKSLGLDLPL